MLKIEQFWSILTLLDVKKTSGNYLRKWFITSILQAAWIFIYYYLLRIFKNNIYENLSRFKFLNAYRFKTFVLLKFKLDHFGEQVHRFLSNFILLNQTFYAAENFFRKRMLNFFCQNSGELGSAEVNPQACGRFSYYVLTHKNLAL